ncbi:ClC family H(+)/Cl(-) exchange transporter [Weissella confusa]|uniref:ClC family H(+)/Cl(-) exchange transporter n=1 Tax=Weissella confusa TaxID=1583 RepID=UPI00109329F9|nr:ClC family H(+)/Cl(-) exchange transporter [Weissella confusa]MBJ7694877.1 ClC family H(+)/Cl(-) exchange transporter [Weissella confusa]QBZ04251.1 ClC family H(+)/Cl(-) exchange transporter [Weissella confusa]
MKIDRTRLLTVGRAVVVGILVGVVVSTFRWLVELILDQWRHVYHQLVVSPDKGFWLAGTIIAMILFTFIVGQIIKGDPNVNGSGIPQVEGQLAGQMTVNPFSVLWRKFTAGLLTIGSGAMLGREGPSIQLGAAVAQLYGEKRGFDSRNNKLMIAMGAAAGLSAAFGAPVAGTLFVLEEVYRTFSTLVWLGALTSAVVADMVSVNVFGLTPVLSMTKLHDLPLMDYAWLPVLGILLGLFGYAYQRATLWAPNMFRWLKWLPRHYHFIVVFLLLIPVGIWAPQALGGGASLILHDANFVPTISVLVGLIVLRFVYSTIAFGSGVPGGIFLPILTLGALAGALFGTVLVHFGLLAPVNVMNMMIVGMAGYFASISKAPFTAIVLIAEMVGSMTHLVAMAIVALIAYLVVDFMGGEPIYESLLARLRLPDQLSALRGRLEGMTFVVAPGSALEDAEVRQLQLPRGVLIQRIRRGSEEHLPNGDFILQVGDELSLLTDEAQFKQVWTVMQDLNKETEAQHG